MNGTKNVRTNERTYKKKKYRMIQREKLTVRWVIVIVIILQRFLLYGDDDFFFSSHFASASVVTYRRVTIFFTLVHLTNWIARAHVNERF